MSGTFHLSRCRQGTGARTVDLGKPMGDFVSEQPVHGILFGPQLIAETAGAEEGNICGLVFDRPAFPSDPDIEVQEARRMRERCYDLALYRNRMLADLSIKCFAEEDNILEVVGGLLR